MKKQLLSVALLALAGTLAFTSCKKDDDGGSNSASAKENLTTGQWRMTANSVTTSMSGGGSSTNDVFATYDACEKDDLTKFEAAGGVTVDEGASKCNSSDPQSYSAGTWALENNNATLALTDGSTERFKIDELNSASLKISKDTTITSGPLSITTSIKINFVK